MSKAEPDDRESFLAAKEGNHRAGQLIVDRFGPSMVRTAWSVLGRYGGSEADDVVQEAFLAALTTRSLPEGDLGAWLRSITARKALDWLRRKRRRKEYFLPEPDGLDEPQAPGSQDAELAAITVRQGLARLRPIDRAVLLLADLEGRSMAEVAEALGITRAAAKLRASRARRKLARILNPAQARGAAAAEGGGEVGW